MDHALAIRCPLLFCSLSGDDGIDFASPFFLWQLDSNSLVTPETAASLECGVAHFI